MLINVNLFRNLLIDINYEGESSIVSYLKYVDNYTQQYIEIPKELKIELGLFLIKYKKLRGEDFTSALTRRSK